jgi:hypothetical protein
MGSLRNLRRPDRGRQRYSSWHVLLATFLGDYLRLLFPQIRFRLGSSMGQFKFVTMSWTLRDKDSRITTDLIQEIDEALKRGYKAFRRNESTTLRFVKTVSTKSNIYCIREDKWGH